MTKENILSVFAKCGIWPTKPDVILDIITIQYPETPSDNSSDEISTPYIVKRIRQFSKIHNRRPLKEAFRKLTKANEMNTTRASIAEHRANGLKEALQMEQKKRRRGKKLNLVGEPSGRAQFFGTEEVMAAQARETEKVVLAEKEKLDKEKEKEEKAVAKAVKEALAVEEKRRKAEQQEINKQVRLEEYNQGILDRRMPVKQLRPPRKRL
jgi:hypothetical protein